VGRSSQSGRGKSCEGEAVAVAVVDSSSDEPAPGLKHLGCLLLVRATSARQNELARECQGLVGMWVCSGIVFVVEVDGRHVAGEPAANSKG